MSMKMLPALLLCSLLLTPAISTANDDAQTEQRLARMEAEIRHLQARIRLLEDALHHSPPARQRNDAFHVCRIKAFTRSYEGESSNPGLARRQAQKACELENDAMFCRIENIQCTRY